MKNDLVPIIVTLFRRPNGHADWPDFKQLDPSILQGMLPSHYIDNMGTGWFRDNVDNLGTGHTHGTALTLVPEDFANAAVAQFPDIVRIADEEEVETFWEERVTINQDVEFIDTEALQGIKTRMDMEAAGQLPIPSQEIIDARNRALDPNDDRKAGLRRNRLKKWEDAKQKLRVTVHPNQRKRQQ